MDIASNDIFWQQPVSMEHLHEIELFYRREAALLDERKFDQWLELLAEDLHYWIPIRQNRQGDQMGDEFTKPGENALIDDDKTTMRIRVGKLDTGYAWAEEPPSRTRHVITNVMATEIEGGDLHVVSDFIIYRNKNESEVDWWVGLREDVLRRDENTKFQVAKRSVYLDQTVIISKNLSTFF
ncbi:3-phenylpropionate/cinnamic acid dioxygenase subunit beta [Nocardia sp. R7R-8]|uniref:3-phenylpropionate/cinnamic acid dioxygenase subunit beta n=1 Tax=Nocardia sp. R7R-8 TaxID=3459304 RepID=UPI00403DE54E